ncbi:MAG TPA: hypothetical protein VHM23_12040 [Actinomycetota bacterium]|nr:hypothetical protein [Actinomycetota bacterium]
MAGRGRRGVGRPGGRLPPPPRGGPAGSGGHGRPRGGSHAFLRGDAVVGTGWLGRAQRLLQDQPEVAAHGYLLYLELEGALGGDDPGAVAERARRLRGLGRRHADPNLAAAGDLFEGRALVKVGRVAEGLARLDEAMLAVRSGELGPEWAGNIYCHLMTAFTELADVRRAAEWTDATSRWLATLPAAVLFTGICRVHRSQVLQRRGAWAQAEREAALVCADLADLQVAGAAEGHYQVGEIRRLHGDLDGAEAAYREAHRLGRDPQPGLALLRLAQGLAAAAAASVRTPWPRWSTTGWPGPGCAPPRSRSPWPPATPGPPGSPATSWSGRPRPTAARAWRRPPSRPGGRSCSPAGAPRRPCRPCGQPAGAGRSWTCRTTPPGCGCCWPAPTRPLATRTPPPWSWTRPLRCSSASAPPSTSPPPGPCGDGRRSRAASPGARPRCWPWSPPAGATARSPRRWS